MLFKFLRIFKFTTYCLLLSTVLIGCATGPRIAGSRFKDAVLIGGRYYVSAETISRVYNLDYQWDSISKRLILSQDNNEARMMVDSSLALLNDEIYAMGAEVQFYRDTVVIPQGFAGQKLAGFFGEGYSEESQVVPIVSGPIKNVIIDAGHGGKDPGAIGRKGLKEKDIVLDVARRLARKLEAMGITVTMTRDSDSFIALSERYRIANVRTKDAPFFVSIHANASRSRWTSGVEVFYLSESIDDNLRSLKAGKSYDLGLKDDYSGKHTAPILRDLIFSENRKEARQLAKFVCYSLSKQLGQKNRGVKQARFFVLKAYIPAILAEVGFISNAGEEKRLRTSAYRDQIAQGLANGIVRYNRKFTQSRTARY